ncbi:MAG: SHOCT domain-containing protein [Burkholderiaceae bacterium]|nr:SHOCT domain-containing protein [Burkholderiaceae bacterium]
MYGFGSGGWMFGGWLMMLLIWLIPFVALFVGLKVLFDRSGPPAASKSALDLLDEAYARGEINRDEYLQKRADLQKK